ncbi:MAG: hypothetical protein ACE3L7_23225 [Candidatus Pristimantibacillus sp.]
MKNYVGVVILLIAVSLVVTGCLSTNKATYMSEQIDLKAAISSHGYSTSLPSDYTLTANIDLKREGNADGISYKIHLEKATVMMENVVISFHLDPRMFDKVNTSHVFTSTTQDNIPIAIGPTGDTLGAVLGRQFVLNKGKIDREMKNIYSTIYAKIAYGPVENRITDYIQLNANVSTELEDYINQNIES